MQLFITNFTKTGNQINIDDKSILDQMRKVLRMKIGDKFFIQKNNTRHQVKILNRDKTTIKGNIINTQIQKTKETNIKKGIIIAMSNKWSKMELIIQKLSELGIKNIYIWPSERSIIKEANNKKMERLYKISKEAIEQSRGRGLPNIEFIKDIKKITDNMDTKIIVFDKSNHDKEKNGNFQTDKHKKIFGIIGPEGGLTDKDYNNFGNNYTTQQLGDTILRTETASIIAGREIKKLD